MKLTKIEKSYKDSIHRMAKKQKIVHNHERGINILSDADYKKAFKEMYTLMKKTASLGVEMRKEINKGC